MGPPGSSREDPFIRVQPPDLPGGLNEDTNSKEPETELLDSLCTTEALHHLQNFLISSFFDCFFLFTVVV